jgi:kinesin family protein 1
MCSLQVPNTFSVCTSHRGFLMQTLNGDEVCEWLYAINPLMAAHMRVPAGAGGSGKTITVTPPTATAKTNKS